MATRHLRRAVDVRNAPYGVEWQELGRDCPYTLTTGSNDKNQDGRRGLTTGPNDRNWAVAAVYAHHRVE